MATFKCNQQRNQAKTWLADKSLPGGYDWNPEQESSPCNVDMQITLHQIQQHFRKRGPANAALVRAEGMKEEITKYQDGGKD